MDIITEHTNEILHTKCEKLIRFDINVISFMNELARTMKKNVGVGLAAPQVGVLMNAFVMLRMDGSILKIINPKILERGKMVTSKREGCLSIPGYTANIKRSKRIKVQFDNEKGEQIKIELRNFESFVFQHEHDHLNGILIID